MNYESVLGLYKDLESQQVKLKVKNKSAIKTN